MKNLLKVTLLMCAIIISVNAYATVYYVKASTGSDSNSGLSSAQAWKTLSKVNSTTFQPGDEIWFRSGEVWNGMLWPKGSGTASNPIKIRSYGQGAKPKINGGATVNCTSESGETNYCALYLYNQEHWIIQNLDITNFKSSEEGGKSISQWESANASNYANVNKPPKYSGSNTRKTGVLIEARNKGKLSGITLKDLEVHGVNGDINEKDSGGIFINIFEENSSDSPTWFDDLLIEDCHIHDVDRTGLSNVSVYDNRTLTNNIDWTPWTDFIVQDNIFERTGANALIVRVADSPLIENNLFDQCSIKETGNAAFVFNTDDAIMQYNEARYTKYNQGDNDAGGLDSDFRTKNTIIQYNYVHDNDFGTLITGGKGGGDRFNDNTIFRYNILENDGILEEPGYGAWAFKISGVATNTHVHNNVIYVGSGKSYNDIVFHKTLSGGTPDNSTYTNNIFYNEGSNTRFDLGSSTGNSFSNNIFYGNNYISEPSDINKITENPDFNNPGGGENGYQISSASPALRIGERLSTTPSSDYYDNSIGSSDLIDIGVDQKSGSELLETVNVDAHIRSGSYSSTNYGNADLLIVKGSGNSEFERQTVLKFDVGDFSSISSAKLLLYGSAQSSVTLNAYELGSDAWNESSVTWNNVPAFDAYIGSFDITPENEWYEIDVTDEISNEIQSGFSIISFGIRDDSKSVIKVEFFSEENSQNLLQPILLISEGNSSSQLNATTAVSEPETGIVTYPNPVDNLLSMQSEKVLTGVSVFDMMGNEIKSFDLRQEKNRNLDFSTFETGMYFLRLRVSTGEIIHRTIIKK